MEIGLQRLTGEAVYTLLSSWEVAVQLGMTGPYLDPQCHEAIYEVDVGTNGLRSLLRLTPAMTGVDGGSVHSSLLNVVPHDDCPFFLLSLVRMTRPDGRSTRFPFLHVDQKHPLQPVACT